VRSRLGHGGFGTVYEAHDRERNASVALKLLHAVQPGALYRFKREFRTLADLIHPNLIALDELFNDGDRWFFTMELIRGQPIVEFVRDGPPRPASILPDADLSDMATESPQSREVTPAEGGTAAERRLRHAFGQLADALIAIHQAGIAHRDVKPSNVLVTADGRTVLLDFGIATQLSPDDISAATVVGTPVYMAPEQAFGHMVSPASDWYSVGVMLYEALTGDLPFTGTALEMFAAKQRGPTELPRNVHAPVLMKLAIALLHQDPAARPTAFEIVQHLKQEGAAPSSVSTAAIADVPALIGRDAHLRALTSAFDAAVDGHPMVVFMPGTSGIGKSALLRRFIADIRERAEMPTVIPSRCHERESVPYKAVDGLVDGITRYLQRLPELAAARQLPRDIPLLARLFPVLWRVTEVERAQLRVVVPPDPVELRRRAATALRELLARMSDRRPLVLVIDDLQWGDLDSASLLLEVLRLPEPPPILLVMAYRSEDSEAPLVRALRSALLSEAGEREVRTLHVEGLTPEQASRLARRELAEWPHLPPERSSEIARESGGNPFFVHELVRHTLSVGGPVRLDSVIRERVEALPTDAQHLLLAIAYSAEPISAAVAAKAAVLNEGVADAVRALRAARLVRVHASAEQQMLEPYHDRVREAMTERESSVARLWHARLATAWDASGLARPDTLVAHYHGAGNVAMTVACATRAAEAAEQALAFRRAADYYRLLVETDEPAVRTRWQARLGDALANAGRGREAAAAYLDALRGVQPGETIELERRAAEQLIRAGYLDQAGRVLKSLLPRIGVRPARTEAGAFAGLLLRRFALALRGTRFRARPESDVAVDDLRRVDVLWSIGAPLSLVELARGNQRHLRGAHYALRAGEPKRVVRAISTLACASAIAGSRRDARTARILTAARALARELDDQTSIAHVALAEAMCHKIVGRWSLAREQLERAIELLAACRGVRWEIETARTLLHDAMFWMGDWKALFDQIPARRQEAEDCGDLYSATHVAVRLLPIAHLAADQPDRARAEALAGMARWPSGHFDLQHRWEVCSVIEANLYAGHAAAAREHLRANWPRLRWTLRAFQNARIEMLFFRARIALALAADGDASALRQASADADRLERERAAWASALATLARAGILACRDDRQAASHALRSASEALRVAGMAHYAAAARYRLGQSLRGPEGTELLTEAEAFFKLQTVVNVERTVALLVPGKWA
jgi:hypothetical protein